MKANKTLLIIRVSTDHQETESQKKELVNYCISKGLKEKDFIFLEVSGASAIKLNEKYNDMIQTIKDYCLSKEVSGVALWHLNRLGRNDVVLVQMKDFFIKNNIQVYIKDFGLTLFNEKGEVNPHTDLLWNFLASTIKADTKELKEKTLRGIKAKKEKGLYSGGGVKFGYKVDPFTQKIEKNYDEISQIEKIYKMYSSGKYSYKSLYEELKQRGVNYRGHLVKPVNIQKILEGDYIKDLIGMNLWEKVQKIRETNNQNHSKQIRYINYGIKLMVCPDCKTNMICNNGYYQCLKRKDSWRWEDKDKCNFKGSIKSEYLDTLLWDLSKDIEVSEMKKLGVNEIKDLLDEKTNIKKKIEYFRNELNKIYRRKNKLKELYLDDDDITKEEYNNKKGKLIADNIHFNSQIEKLNSQIEVIEDKIRIIKEKDKNPSLTLEELENIGKEEKFNIIHKNLKKVDIIQQNKKKIIVIIDIFDNVYKYEYFPKNKQNRFKGI